MIVYCIQHCQALQRCKVYRSEYWDGALDCNSCSRLLDNLDIIPFPSHHTSLLNALKSIKMVKDRCLGLLRKPGWEESICLFRESWDATGLPWSLKSHILSDHYMEYFFYYEPQLTAGAAISSEQSGEMLHSRIQNLWDLRFKTKLEHELYPQRLVDCMVTYNYNLRWDNAERLSKEQGNILADTCSDCHDEESDIERVELHNWDTDEESSDID